MNRKILSFGLGLFLSANSVYAIDYSGKVGSNNKPVLLSAKEVGYDQQGSIAIAVGNVEMVQEDTIILADRVTYNQKTDEVHAIGNVSILEPSGDVVFADDVKLQKTLQTGVVAQFKARLKDNSLFAANEAQKVDKNVTILHQAVYSPCKVCKPKEGEAASAPLWQMEASRVKVDDEAKRVRYKHAFMEVYGVPVFYTPYFSHPTPDAPSESGFLIPKYSYSEILGNVVEVPVFVSFASNTDMTLTPWYMGNYDPLLKGEFRHLFEDGTLTLRGAITDTASRDYNGKIIPGSERTRDYIEGHGTLNISDHWKGGTDFEVVSDDTFLAFYSLGWKEMLTSKIYAERIEDRDYVLLESVAFQGLQPKDIRAKSPYALPQVDVHLESDTLFAGSRVENDSNLLVIERRLGDSSQRLSNTVAWKLPYISKDGQIIEAKASIRGDAYAVNDLALTNGENFSGETGRVIPQLDLNWRYPFANNLGEGKSLMLSPVVESSLSPNLRNFSNIPNNDSQISEFSNINLFSSNRFAGLDQIESGLRTTYGMRGHFQLEDEKYIEWLFGQAYQENESSSFPLAHTQNVSFSDYVGDIGLKYNKFDLYYRFRIDRQTFEPTSNEVNAYLTINPFRIDASFISLKDQPLFGERKEVFGSVGVDLNENWTWNLNGRKDLSNSSASVSTSNSSAAQNINLFDNTSSGTVGLGTGIIFHNECVNITTNAGRSYISRGDVKPTTTYSVVLTLKNFGDPGSGITKPDDDKDKDAVAAVVGDKTGLDKYSH